MSDSISKGSTFLLIGQISLMFSTFVIQWALAHFGGLSVKGSFDLATTTGSLAVVVASAAMYNGFTYYMAKNRIRVSWAILTQVQKLSFLQAVLGGLALWLLYYSSLSSAIFPSTELIWVGMIGLYLLCNLLYAYVRGLYAALGMFAAVTPIDLLLRFLSLIAVVALAIVLKRSSSTAIWAFSATAVVTLAAYFVALQRIPKDGDSAKLGLKPIVDYSYRSLSAAIAQELNFRLGTFLLAYYATKSDVGIYFLSQSLVQILWIPSSSLQSAIFPRLSRTTDEEERKDLFAQCLRMNAVITICASLLFLILCPLIPYVFGDQLRSCLPVCLTMLPAVAIFGMINNVSASLNNSSGHPEYNSTGSMIGLITFAVCGLFWVHPYGISGAVWSMSSSYLATALYVAYRAGSISRVSIAQAIPRAEDLRKLIELARNPRQLVA